MPTRLVLFGSTDPDHWGVRAQPSARLGPLPTPALRPTSALDELERAAEQYVQEAHAPRTREAYQTIWDAFATWCTSRIRTLERGIGRTHGAREEGAPTLLDHELAQVVKTLGRSPRDDRDRVLLVLGVIVGAVSSTAGPRFGSVRGWEESVKQRSAHAPHLSVGDNVLAQACSFADGHQLEEARCHSDDGSERTGGM